MKYVYKVWSDDFCGAFLSIEAFEEEMLSMSTANYMLHRSLKLNASQLPPEAEILCYDSESNVWFTILAQEMSA
jgi:hypothetical protein